MKTLKIIPMLLLLISFMACKKDKAAPEPTEGPFDITKYVIVEKGIGFKTNDPIIVTFEPQGKTSILTILGGGVANHTYTYNNGVLKIFYEGELMKEFKIENKTITSTRTGASYSCQLIKIPTAVANVFNGNTYSGGWKIEGTLLTSVASLKFTDTHYSEAAINLPVPNKEYTLIKNLAAQSYHDGVGSIWLLIDGKLEGNRFNPVTLKETTGTFTKTN